MFIFEKEEKRAPLDLNFSIFLELSMGGSTRQRMTLTASGKVLCLVVRHSSMPPQLLARGTVIYHIVCYLHYKMGMIQPCQVLQAATFL